MTDVNQGASPAPAASSPAQGQTGPTQGVSEGGQSAGTLNTERLPDSIPYARFKEVNDKLRAVEQEYTPYKEKADLYKTYEQFDSILSQRPEMMQLVQVALTQPQVASQILQSLGMSQGQANQVVQQTQESPVVSQLALMTYTNEFERLATESQIPKELIPEYFNMTKDELLRINPDPLKRLNMNDLRTAFKNATDRARKFTAPYQQQKGGLQGLPPSSSANGGAPVATVPQMDSQASRAAWLADQLRAGMQV